MLEAFKKYNSENKLFSQKNSLLLTVSGGIDSVVMCDLFHEAQIKFAIAHCNFKLRGAESDEDEHFAKKLAGKYNVSFFSKHFNTDSYASEKNISIQMAARELRYEWFEEIRKVNKYQYIATAHHKGDVAETMLINFIRGTGIHGLHGILPKQNKIIRPLLFASREDIITYATEKKLSWREDSSNTSDKYLRNNFRLNIIPELKKINPSLENSLFETAQQLHDAEKAINTIVASHTKTVLKKSGSKTTIDIKKLEALQPLAFYLFEMLKEYGFNGDTVKNIIRSFNTISGKIFYSDSHQLIKDRKRLIISKVKKKSQKNYSFKKVAPQITSPVKITLKKVAYTSGFKIPVAKNIACFDFDNLSNTLQIRRWRHGDSFHPLGMKGEKKLSDFFVDNKFSLVDKENTWLLVSNEDIVWVVAQRIDERYKVTAKTKHVLICTLTD